MKLSQFKFRLPEDQVALEPSYHRDECRLMVVHRKSGKIEIEEEPCDIELLVREGCDMFAYQMKEKSISSCLPLYADHGCGSGKDILPG